MPLEEVFPKLEFISSKAAEMRRIFQTRCRRRVAMRSSEDKLESGAASQRHLLAIPDDSGRFVITANHLSISRVPKDIL